MSTNDARGIVVAPRFHGLKDPEHSQTGQEQQKAVGRGRCPGNRLLPPPKRIVHTGRRTQILTLYCLLPFYYTVYGFLHLLLQNPTVSIA